MIKQEFFILNNKEFVRTYSDEGRYVVRDDVEYDEAQDFKELNRQYTEGNFIPIDKEEEEREEI